MVATVCAANSASGGERGGEVETLVLIRGADFWIFWIFNRWQPAADVKCFSKTKEEKALFFISCLPLRK
jgi:hypothetical protein